MERRSASGTSRIPAARSRSRPSVSGCASTGSTATSSPGRRTSWRSRRTPPTTFSPERIAQGRRTLHERFGMPMAWTPPPALAATIDSCRAVVAARVHTADGCGPLLRRLRVLCFSGLALDDPDVIARAASEAGLDPTALAGGWSDPEVERGAARRHARRPLPSPASRAQDYKLGGPPEERRYTCPSYEIERTAPPHEEWHTADRVDLPGFRPVEAYETALANIAPELTRRPDPRRSGRCSPGPACRSPPRRSPRSATGRPPTSARSSRTSPRFEARRRRRLLGARVVAFAPPVPVGSRPGEQVPSMEDEGADGMGCRGGRASRC